MLSLTRHCTSFFSRLRWTFHRSNYWDRCGMSCRRWSAWRRSTGINLVALILCAKQLTYAVLYAMQVLYKYKLSSMSMDFINLCDPPVKWHQPVGGLNNELSNDRMTFHLTYAIVYCSCKKISVFNCHQPSAISSSKCQYRCRCLSSAAKHHMIMGYPVQCSRSLYLVLQWVIAKRQSYMYMKIIYVYDMRVD